MASKVRADRRKVTRSDGEPSLKPIEYRRASVAFRFFQVTWVIALLSPLCMYVITALHVELLLAVTEWSTVGRDFAGELVWDTSPSCRQAYSIALAMALVAMFLPRLWYRNALARLRRTVTAHGKSVEAVCADVIKVPVCPLSEPQTLVRRILGIYSVRLAAELALTLPIFFVAFSEAQIAAAYRLGGATYYFPEPQLYLPICAILTLTTMLHMPTHRRVFGKNPHPRW